MVPYYTQDLKRDTHLANYPTEVCMKAQGRPQLYGLVLQGVCFRVSRFESLRQEPQSALAAVQYLQLYSCHDFKFFYSVFTTRLGSVADLVQVHDFSRYLVYLEVHG